MLGWGLGTCCTSAFNQIPHARSFEFTPRALHARANLVAREQDGCSDKRVSHYMHSFI